MTTTALFLFLALGAIVVVAVPAAVLLVRMTVLPPAETPASLVPELRDRGDEARSLGFVHEGGGHWVADLHGAVRLDGHDEGDALHHVQRMWVEGPWTGVSVRPGRAPSTPTGDGAFDRDHVVEGTALFRLDDAVREALSVDVRARLVLVDGQVVATPEPEADLGKVLGALLAARDALDAAPVDDAALASDAHQRGAVRAEALRRVRDETLAAQLLDDADPEVRLVAAMLADPGALRGIVLDVGAPSAVRHKAAVSLPVLDDEVLEAMVASDAPALWSMVAKVDLAADRRVDLLRRLLRPGALDADAWPEDQRVPHVATKLGLAVVEARPPDADALLMALLAMPAPRVRLQAVRGLRAVGGASAMEAVRGCIDDPDARVRQEALDAMEVLEGAVRGGVSLAPLAEGQGAVSLVDPAVGALAVPSSDAPRRPSDAPLPSPPQGVADDPDDAQDQQQ